VPASGGALRAGRRYHTQPWSPAEVDKRKFEMKLKTNQKGMMKSKLLLVPILTFILFASSTIKSDDEYDQTVSQWKSYEDVVRWMVIYFEFDMERYKAVQGGGPRFFPPRAPRETFKLKSGVCYDGAVFAAETLNRIDPSYKAKVVFIENRPFTENHYVCSFEIEGKLFIMDYATIYWSMRGVHGPFDSLEDYKEFYETHHPEVRDVISIRYWNYHF